MIRHALIALGLSAGAAHGQGMVQTAPLLETCGGTRLVLEAEGDPGVDVSDRASAELSDPSGGVPPVGFTYWAVKDAHIIVSLPSGGGGAADVRDPEVQGATLGLSRLDETGHETGPSADIAARLFVLPAAFDAKRGFAPGAEPVLAGAPSVSTFAVVHQAAMGPLAFDDGDDFGPFTGSRISKLTGVVGTDDVLATPAIQNRIDAGSGILAGNMIPSEGRLFAAIPQSGVLPFDVSVSAQEVMDGSDPSADFCP